MSDMWQRNIRPAWLRGLDIFDVDESKIDTRKLAVIELHDRQETLKSNVTPHSAVSEDTYLNIP